MRTMKMVKAAALKSKVARLKDVGRQTLAAAALKKGAAAAELNRIARDIFVLAAEEEVKLEQLDVPAPTSEPAPEGDEYSTPPAPAADSEDEVRKQLYDALKSNKLDEASAALGKLRRLARSRRGMGSADDMAPPPAEMDHLEPDGDELPPPPPPAPEGVGASTVLSAREVRELRTIAHRVRVEGHPDLAKKLRSLIK